jgi:hypothetical protein
MTWHFESSRLSQLKYHQQIPNLLSMELDMLASRVAIIEERERACGVLRKICN